ncbi:hypothetical protein K440DRAFT_613339 [Wilcoxina mikolae CBS 423.85]|nr:hypothetical protein K440DRAFT_613339 [Wilcoxina mikolae CBS 423.85]
MLHRTARMHDRIRHHRRAKRVDTIIPRPHPRGLIPQLTEGHPLLRSACPSRK